MIYLTEHPELDTEIILIPKIDFNRIVLTCKVINHARFFAVFV